MSRESELEAIVRDLAAADIVRMCRDDLGDWYYAVELVERDRH